MMMNRAVFLDRDGTIIEDRNFICRTEDVQLLPRAAGALRLLERAGYMLFIVTNQSGVGRGLFTIEDVNRLNDHLCRILADRTVTIHGVFACPHHPDDGCTCRKPSPQSILAAAKSHRIDLAQSYMIGDRLSDVQTGKNAGCIPILVETGLGKDTLAKSADQLRDILVMPDLAAAARRIVKSRTTAVAA